jgi:purine-binding chemotaxis protein CheW
MNDQADDSTPIVTAQQAIEDFLFEMIPAHNELPDRLREQQTVVEAPKPVAKKKSKRKAIQSPLLVEPENALAASERIEAEAFDVARAAWAAAAIELEQQRLEQQRLEQQRLEQERLEQERLEQQQLEQQRLEQERLEQQRLEQERLKQQRLNQQQLERERAEEESFRVAAEHAEQQRRLREQKIRDARLLEEQKLLEQKQKQKLEEQRLTEQKAQQKAQQIALARERAAETARLASLNLVGDEKSFVDRSIQKSSTITPSPTGPTSLATMRHQEKHAVPAAQILEQVREPVSIEMKLIRARLASSFEETVRQSAQEPVGITVADNPVDSAAAIPEPILRPVLELRSELRSEPRLEPVKANQSASHRTDQAPAPVMPSGLAGLRAKQAKHEQAKSVNLPSAKATIAPSEDVAAEGRLDPPADWTDEGRPVWASGRFECLLFTVAGLKLAVPLVALGSIHPVQESFTTLVGRANWFMGLMSVPERRLRVVDTGLWVMPEKYRESFRENYKYVIRLGRSNWGIACDQVTQAITLRADEVRWRTQRSKRPWLAGTVVEYMCALMDVETFEYLLAEADRTGKPMQF